ncbi:MAG: hypothetical protein JRI87_07520 [Deltaproteobacteria bacterium]|nr:hypothetical protein [Deltaproteobacteria bacterium]
MKTLSKVLLTGLPLITVTKAFAADDPTITFGTVGHLASKAPMAVGGFLLVLCIALAGIVTWEKVLVKFHPLQLLKRIRLPVLKFRKSSPSFPGYARTEME